MQTVALSIKINLFCFVYYLAEQMVVVWHNSVLFFSCCFLFGEKKKTAQKPELLFPLCHSWLPINLNSWYSDDSTWCPGARYDWVTFFSNVSYQAKKKKRYLYSGDCHHMTVPLSLIKPGNNDCIYTGLRLAYFAIRITEFLLGFPHQ